MKTKEASLRKLNPLKRMNNINHWRKSKASPLPLDWRKAVVFFPADAEVIVEKNPILLSGSRNFSPTQVSLQVFHGPLHSTTIEIP